MQAPQHNSAETTEIVMLSHVLRGSRGSVAFVEGTRIQLSKTPKASCPKTSRDMGLMLRTHVPVAAIEFGKPHTGIDRIERGGKLRRRIEGKWHPDC
jgi:hypothetical protein